MARNRDFYDGLKRLFSGEVIVRHIGKKQLKIIDTDTVQLAHRVDRFNRLRKRDTINLGVVNQYSYSDTRIELFRDYESMDRDALISSALDLYSEECSTKNEFGDVLAIKTDNQDIKEILENLFYDIVNIEFTLPS